jgi:hypothetical protein
MRFTEQQISALLKEIKENKESRKYLTSKSLYLFAAYYYGEYFVYKTPDFHFDYFECFQDLVEGRIPHGAWVGFAESAKTSIAKIGLAWIACNKKKRYVNVDSYDKENSERLLYELVENLQGNQKIIDDFGQLYNAPRSKEKVQVKRISNFVTNNGIRFEAHSVGVSVRGRVHNYVRPDFFLFDDIENSQTIRSNVVTSAVIAHYDEVKRGLAPNACTLLLGNYLSESGSVAYVIKSVKNSGGRVIFTPVVDKKGNIAWPDKYVLTDKEAEIVNATLLPEQKKVSLEFKKRDLNGGGKRNYELEMLLDPVSAGTTFFDRQVIQKLIDNVTDPKEIKADFYIWKPYRPSDLYGVGGDPAKGNGGDSAASCLINYNTIPAEQIGSYANNMIQADQFAYELKREADLYGTCIIGPEKNNECGGSCLTTLKLIYPIEMIYQQVPIDKNNEKPIGSGELGWETNNATKYLILNDLKSAVESGQLIINDIRILNEMRSFTYTDADELGSSRIGHSTNHFDLLMATAIAWYMRKFAKQYKLPVDNYVQGAYESSGL